MPGVWRGPQTDATLSRHVYFECLIRGLNCAGYAQGAWRANDVASVGRILLDLFYKDIGIEPGAVDLEKFPDVHFIPGTPI